jgi:hypothetical protein
MKLRRFLMIVGLMAASMSAYQSDPAPNSPQSVQIVKVRTASSCGWCTNPSEQETVVERNSISLISRSLSDRKAPDFKMQYKITKKDWNDLNPFIDATVLSAFDVPTGCPVVRTNLQAGQKFNSATGQRSPPLTTLGANPLPS